MPGRARRITAGVCAAAGVPRAMRSEQGASFLISAAFCGKACGFWWINCSTSRWRRTSTSCLILTLRLISIGLSGVLTEMQLASGAAARRPSSAGRQYVVFHGHLSLGWGWGDGLFGTGVWVCCWSSSPRRTSVTIPGRPRAAAEARCRSAGAGRGTIWRSGSASGTARVIVMLNRNGTLLNALRRIFAGPLSPPRPSCSMVRRLVNSPARSPSSRTIIER